DYYCLYADLCLERDDEISAAEALMAASKQNPSHPRVLALQARIRARQGSAAEARAMFRDFAAPFLDPQTSPKSGPQLLTSLAEAGLELEEWDTTEILLDRAMSKRPREIWPALLRAKNLVLCAEAQALAESLEIVTHAPGRHSLSGERYAKIEQLLRACHASLKSNERAQPLKEWERRADAVFHGEIKGLTDLEREFGRDENALALIVDARRAGWTEHSIKTARTHLQHPLVRGLLALSLADEDLDEDALREADEAVRQNPGDPRIHFAAAKTLWHAGEGHEAVSSIERALEIWPDEPAWHVLAADWLADGSGTPVDGAHERAAAHMEQAVHLDPGNPGYLVRLGEIQVTLGAVDDAIYRFQEACQLIPRDPLPWTRLAAAQLVQGQYETAEKSALIAMELSPEDLEPLVLYARVAWAEGNSPEALERIAKVQARDSANPKALHLKALALASLNRPTEALSAIDLAIKNASDPQPFLIDRARILARTQGKNQSLTYLEELSASYPDDPAVFGLMARTLVEVGDSEKAIAAAQKALKKGSNALDHNELAYLNELVGRLQRRSGQLDQAIHHLSEAVRLDPHSVEAYTELGQAYLDRRDYVQAFETMQKAISIHPSDARLYYQAGVTLKESKDFQRAEGMLRKAAELSPSDLSIHRQLGAVVALNIVNNSREAALSL
ncbi:MAG TPA: tetratricopeptide repeat protein, partial [Anaerolineales bacterium]|nr:tetratricopeptide repeat protein [Anaerolineales bacterium]